MDFFIAWKIMVQVYDSRGRATFVVCVLLGAYSAFYGLLLWRKVSTRGQGSIYHGSSMLR